MNSKYKNESHPRLEMIDRNQVDVTFVPLVCFSVKES